MAAIRGIGTPLDASRWLLLRGLTAVAACVAAIACAAATPPAQLASPAPQPLIGRGRGIDHVTLLTHDLAGAARRFAEDFGFVVGPPQKLSFGFENAMIYFADLTYIELYAVHDRDMVGRSSEAFALDAPEGITWVTFNVDTTERVAKALQTLGHPVFGPIRRPDTAEDWGSRLTGPLQPFLPGGRIFFIEYNERVRASFRAENGALIHDRERHANSAEGLRSIWITVPDLAAATAAYAAAGMNAEPEIALPALSARAREIRMPGGTILLAERTDRGTSSAADAARFAGISVKVASIDAVRQRVRERLGVNLEPYAGLYGRSVLVPAALGHGTAIEFFQ